MMFFIDSKSSTKAEKPAEEEQQRGPRIVPKECTRFTLESSENILAMLQHLDEHGYAVIANVVPSENEIKHAKNLFWQYAEEKSPGLKRNDLSTWGTEDYWLVKQQVSAGIIGSPDFSHSEFSWFGRVLPKVRQTFSAIWQTNEEDLIVSYDAGNAYRPWEVNPSWTTKGNWWHTDQNSLNPAKQRQGKVCIQGLITYTDVDSDFSGGFCCLPGTHSFHHEMCKRTKYAILNSMTDYVKVDPTDPLLSSHAPAILPLAKAGDMIVWDSRLIHANTPGLKAPVNNPENPIKPLTKEEWVKNIPMYEERRRESRKVKLGIDAAEDATATTAEEDDDLLLRLVTYVCMVPRHFATLQALNSKKLGLLQGKAAFHWPQEPIETAKPYDEEEAAAGRYRDLTTCSTEMLRLAGFSEEEIVARTYIKCI